MGSLGYKSLYIIYLLKSWCAGGMLLTALLFSIRCYPGVGMFSFSSVSPGENKSIPDFLPSQLAHWQPPRKWCSWTGSQKPVGSVHTMAPPHSHTHPSPPDLAGLLHFPLPVTGPGKPVYTTEMPRGQGGWAGWGRKLRGRSSSGRHSPLACVKRPSTSPCHRPVKDTIDK